MRRVVAPRENPLLLSPLCLFVDQGALERAVVDELTYPASVRPCPLHIDDQVGVEPTHNSLVDLLAVVLAVVSESFLLPRRGPAAATHLSSEVSSPGKAGLLHLPGRNLPLAIGQIARHGEGLSILLYPQRHAMAALFAIPVSYTHLTLP